MPRKCLWKRLHGLRPQFPLGHLTPPHWVRFHRPSPSLSPHSDFGFVDSSSYSFDSTSSQPHIATMSGTTWVRETKVTPEVEPLPVWSLTSNFSPIWLIWASLISTSSSMILYSMALIGPLCLPSFLLTSLRSKVILEKIPLIMFAHFICGVLLIPSLKTPSIFFFSNAPLLELFPSGMWTNCMPPIPPSRRLPKILCHTSSYPSDMTLVPNPWPLSITLLPPAYLTMFENGAEGGACVGLLNLNIMAIWIGSLEHIWPPLVKMSPITSPSLRKKCSN